MNTKTFGEIRLEVEKDLDLENEEFISPDEMVINCNDAVSEAEAIIQKLNEDYFLKSGSFLTVAGQEYYPLPTDCYVNKIRKLLYCEAASVYEVLRLRGQRAFEAIETMNLTTSGSNQALRYMLFNQSVYDPSNPLTSGIMIRLVPVPAFSGETLKIFYIRQASKIPLVTGGSQAITDATTIDIPEFYPFIKAAMKAKCVAKEGHPKFELILADYQYLKKLMVETLTERTPDDNNCVEMDFSHYNDHV